MSGLQNFVKGPRNGRPESPHNGQPQVNQQRAMHAANLKVSMRPEVARPPTAQGLHGRGESIAPHQSASLQQQHLKRRPSGEGQKRDQYDTDAESLDTTINRSVIQVEDTQQFDQQQFQPDDEKLESSGDEDEEASGEDLGDDDFEITGEVRRYLAQHGKASVSHEEQIRFLQTTQPQLFDTPVDGDSYPTTTDGNPTEWDGQQEQPLEDLGSPSPSSQRLFAPGSNGPMVNHQPLQRHQVVGVLYANHAEQQNSKLFRQSAQIRGQQRFDSAAHARGQSGQQHATFEPPTSQPPTYSQTTRGQGLVAPPTTNFRSDIIAQGAQSGSPQRSTRLPPVSGHTQNPVPRIAAPLMTSKHVSATRPKTVAIDQHYVESVPVEPAPVEEHAEHIGDYRPEALFKMKYEELRDESFDKNPRVQEPTVPEDEREKPLHERLQFAQRELDPADQAKFFSALSTTEWENAGDWFLEQFTAIIAKTREARQNKRKQAQEFEEEIEKRHKHVAKKQRLVGSAMAKMQAQGEGLVPKSPRASKSPRPRRGREQT